jgi:enoyl-CoA hydratase/carnithine racemase
MGCSHFLPQIVGPQLAARMMLTGEVIDGQEALERRLVAAVNEDAVGAAQKIAGQMAQAAPIAVRTCLQTLRQQGDEGLDRALEREAGAQAQCYASADYFEGLQALQEKRRPVFQQYERYDA